MRKNRRQQNANMSHEPICYMRQKFDEHNDSPMRLEVAHYIGSVRQMRVCSTLV